MESIIAHQQPMNRYFNINISPEHIDDVFMQIYSFNYFYLNYTDKNVVIQRLTEIYDYTIRRPVIYDMQINSKHPG